VLQVNEEQIREFFSTVAGVKEVRILKEKATGRSRVCVGLTLGRNGRDLFV
jgi:hypothetical protein